MNLHLLNELSARLMLTDRQFKLFRESHRSNALHAPKFIQSREDKGFLHQVASATLIDSSR